MKSNYKRLGGYIQEVNLRNEALQDIKLLGVSIQKIFIPSIANTIGTDMSTYKLIKRGQFAYGPVTSRNGDKISVALLDDLDDALISQAYISFEIKNLDEMLPEYLMMWFRRPEFDRYTRFMSHGSAREIFSWEDMCDVQLPVPSIDKQLEIVKEYQIIVDKIDINNKLISNLEEVAQVLYKQWFVDFEFPDESGLPYKSSGGEMNCLLEDDMCTPIGWKQGTLDELYNFQYGFGNVNPDNGGEYPVYGSNGKIGRFSEFNNVDSPVIGHIGANCGSLIYAPGKHFVTYNGVMCKIKNGYDKYFGYSVLQNLDLKSNTRGTSQPFISYDMLNEINILIPNELIIIQYGKIVTPLFDLVNMKKLECEMLELLRTVILSRLALIGGA